MLFSRLLCVPFFAVGAAFAADGSLPVCGEVTAGLKPKQKRVLFVEDNEQVAKVFKAFGSIAGYEVVLAHSGQEARTLASAGQFDGMLFDHELPDATGEALAEELAKVQPLAAIGFVSGDFSDAQLRQVGRLNLWKPFDGKQLREFLGRMFSSVTDTTHDQ